TIADTTKIVPGQNLIATSYTLTNGSNIETELRVKITMTSSYLAGDASSIIDLTMGTGWVQSGDYWYLQGSPAVEASGKYSIPATATTPITVVTSIILDGSLVGNVYSTTTITINFLFEAKQTDYVTWAELGSANIDFSTGLAA
ncbi:MAG: hypothetical protein PHP41_04820, partial [Bacilli bacterium]|nr:hypothetical protein [Bacilli bacterium]